jgi:hypothetical protein
MTGFGIKRRRFLLIYSEEFVMVVPLLCGDELR